MQSKSWTINMNLKCVRWPVFGWDSVYSICLWFTSSTDVLIQSWRTDPHAVFNEDVLFRDCLCFSWSMSLFSPSEGFCWLFCFLRTKNVKWWKRKRKKEQDIIFSHGKGSNLQFPLGSVSFLLPCDSLIWTWLFMTLHCFCLFKFHTIFPAIFLFSHWSWSFLSKSRVCCFDAVLPLRFCEFFCFVFGCCIKLAALFVLLHKTVLLYIYHKFLLNCFCNLLYTIGLLMLAFNPLSSVLVSPFEPCVPEELP